MIFATKKSNKHYMERKKHPILIYKSVPFLLCKHNTEMTNTRTIYFSCFPLVYNIQVKTLLKICWRKCILRVDSNAALAAKWLKMYIILQLFFQNQPFLQFLQLLQLLLLSAQPACFYYWLNTGIPLECLKVTTLS